MHYHGHRKRLRDRLKNSPAQLGDYEILELLLGYVILRRDTKPIAKELLSRFGSLRGVVQARPEEYLDIDGLGRGVADFLLLLREFTPRYAESRLRKRETLCAPEEVAAVARERLGALAHEEVWVAYVDSRNRLMSWEKLAQGTVEAAVVRPRLIMERTLELKASGFILVHNHPGGDPRPSAADADITQRLEHAAHTLLLRFVDHVIISEDKCFSMMRDGFL